jgi:hypothetical protein
LRVLANVTQAFRYIRLAAVTSPRLGRENIDLQLNAVRMTPPVSHIAAALIPTFGRLYGTLDAFCATDHDGTAEGTWTYDRRSRADF